MSTARRLPRGRAWPRLLVLLFVLLVPAAHTNALTAPPMSVESVEYDTSDTAVRPPAPAAHRPAAPARPAAVAAAAPAATAVPGARPCAAPPLPPQALRARRSVVLRC
ncbi:hypothetical protein ABT301_06975 [Streptomyces sp. NPDC000987]|uniref:hypothetical protein n=1 Tax=Streptomyces sp. NPDC000987 TaxID=3154374 RepID=UPI003326EDA8